MRRLILTTTLCIALSSVMAQPRWNSAYQSYIDQYKNLAIEQMEKHQIPASITLAQGLLESGAGRSTLASKGNNHFGIKCHDWTGARMYKDDDAKDDCFRVYRNPRESFEDHSRFLKRSRYQKLFSLDITDYKGWANGLKACGYATSPTYALQLISIIELYNLQEYDIGTTFTRAIGYCNSNYYVTAKRGDTFKSISTEMGISQRKLARYNDLNKDCILTEGDIIYLLKKRKKADKAYKNRPHIIQTGESLHSISQKYAIRLKYLYKKNHLSPDYAPCVGDTLVVY